MKQYGFNKATEISAKQINVIYGCAKRGDLKVEKWVMKKMYNLADYYGYDYNGSVEREEASVKRILDAVFAKDYQEAQRLINIVYDINNYTADFQANANHDLVA